MIDDEYAREVTRVERDRYISPGCCEVMRRCKIIVMGLQGDKPAWRLRVGGNGSGIGFQDMELFVAERAFFDEVYARHKRGEVSTMPAFVPEPTHCPFCGALMPEIVKNENPPTPLMQSDDDNYCSTCGERLMNCPCWPAWFAWKAKVA